MGGELAKEGKVGKRTEGSTGRKGGGITEAKGSNDKGQRGQRSPRDLMGVMKVIGSNNEGHRR